MLFPISPSPIFPFSLSPNRRIMIIPFLPKTLTCICDLEMKAFTTSAQPYGASSDSPHSSSSASSSAYCDC